MKKLLAAVLLLCASVCSYGQGATILFPPVTDPQGHGVPFVTINFCTTPTTVTNGVCNTPVTVFQNSTLSTPYSSAIQTDGLGNFPPNVNTATAIWFSPAANYCYSLSGSITATNICYPFSVPVANGASPTFAGLTVTAPGINTSSLASSGLLTAPSATIGRLQKDCRVDGTDYATWEAVQADSANCKSLVVPSGFSESFTGGIFTFTRLLPVIFEGCGISLTGQITAAGTINSVSMVSHGSLSNGSVSCVDLTYTGTGAAISIGDSSTHSKDFQMRGVNINISGNGATCLKLANIDEFDVSWSKCSITAGTSPIAIITNGTGTFVGVGKFDNVQIISGGGTNGIGYQFQNGTTHTQIVGGNINLDAGASGICFDVQGSTTNAIELVYPNANTCNTAVKVESTATLLGAIVGDLRVDSGVTTVANYATGTSGNFIRCVNCATNAAYTDSGSNSVEFPIQQQVNNKLFRQRSDSGGFFIVDIGDSIAALSKVITGATQINASSGNPVRLNGGSSGATGTEFWGAGAATAVVDQNGTFHPAVAGAVGLGTPALPVKNLTIGNAATNNTLWQPATSAARVFTTPDGNSSSVMAASLVTTAATTDAVTVTGATSSSHCSVTPTNASAATNIATTFVSTKAANTITVTHSVTANMNYDLLCTSN